MNPFKTGNPPRSGNNLPTPTGSGSSSSTGIGIATASGTGVNVPIPGPSGTCTGTVGGRITLPSQNLSQPPPPVPKPQVYRRYVEKELSLTHNLCAVCCRVNARLCLGCRRVAFCSATCQQKAWPVHKLECAPPSCVVPEKAVKALEKEWEFQRRVWEGVSFEEEEEGKSEASGADEDGSGDSGSGKGRGGGGSEEQPGETAEAGEKGVEDQYNGMLMTRKEIEQCGLVVSVAPTMVTCCVEHHQPNPPNCVMCVACTKWYPASYAYKCSQCRSAVCSIECEENYVHAKFECGIFRRLGQCLQDHSEVCNDALLVLRCLMLKTVDPPKYKELEVLMGPCAKLMKRKEYLTKDRRVMEYLKGSGFLEGVTAFTDEELMVFMNVVDACSIVMKDRLYSQVIEDKKVYFGPKFVFPLKLFVGQDCAPNCKWTVKHSPNLEECYLRLHASVKLQPFTYATACFENDQNLIGSWFQPDLSYTKYHNRCTCKRCRDPTELGSFFSGIKCSCGDTQVGYLVPIQPLNRKSVWKCWNKKCSSSMKAEEAQDRVLKFHKEIHKSDVQIKFYVLFQLMWKLEQEFHTNHFLIMKICVMCVMLFWGSVRGLPFFSPRGDFFIITSDLAKCALKIQNAVSPGSTVQRARVLFQLSVATAFQELKSVRRHMEWGDLDRNRVAHFGKQSPTPGHPQTFWDIISLQEEALKIFKTEPFGTVEHEMALVVEEVINDQRDVLSNTLKDVNLDTAAVYNLHKVYSRFSNHFYFPAVPVFEDKDVLEFLVMTGPCARHLVERLSYPL